MVCSIKKLNLGSRDYYVQTSDYYSEGSDKGRWLGQGAKELGLDNTSIEYKDQKFDALFIGKHPHDPERKLRNISLGSREYRSTDKDGNEVVKLSHPVMAIDFTLSAPKPFSVLCAVVNANVRAELELCHELAVNKTAEALSEHTYTRFGQGGYQRELSKPVIAAFTHNTSRNLDPDWHTHLVVINSALGNNDKWRSLDAREFNKDLIFKLGAIYRNELRYQLETKLNVNTYDVEMKNGISFGIKGVPAALCKEWSKRRNDIEAEIQRRFGNATPTSKENQKVADDTRRAKQKVNPEELFKGWQKEASEFGFDYKKVFKQEPSKKLTQSELNFSISKAIENKSFVNDKNLLKTAFDESRGSMGYEQVKTAVDVYKKKNLYEIAPNTYSLNKSLKRTLYKITNPKGFSRKDGLSFEEREKKREAFKRRVTFLYATYKIDYKTYKRLISDEPPEVKSAFSVQFQYATWQISAKQRDYYLSILERKKEHEQQNKYLQSKLREKAMEEYDL